MSLCSASYISCQCDTARICCWVQFVAVCHTMQQVSDEMDRQKKMMLNSFIDPALHTKRAVSVTVKLQACHWLFYIRNEKNQI